ncbi:MAG: CBS domain-containing protein [Actinophytocola sp.]|uniref:CBS domain-containing protein n=1 Tax=Actinophytocola sp. TaxID=1872138 RepID=UPI003D6C39EF
MTTRVVTVGPETPFRELIAKMTEARVRAVPVVDRRGQPIGVVARADLPSQHGWYRSPERTAAELMTTPVRAVHADEPVSFAARQLAKCRLRRLFVVDWDGRLVGVVARRDLLRVFPRGDDELRTQLVGLLRAAEVMPGGVDAQRVIAARPGVRLPLPAARAAYRGGIFECGDGPATLVPAQRRP